MQGAVPLRCRRTGSPDRGLRVSRRHGELAFTRRALGLVLTLTGTSDAAT